MPRDAMGNVIPGSYNPDGSVNKAAMDRKPLPTNASPRAVERLQQIAAAKAAGSGVGTPSMQRLTPAEAKQVAADKARQDAARAAGGPRGPGPTAAPMAREQMARRLAADKQAGRATEFTNPNDRQLAMELGRGATKPVTPMGSIAPGAPRTIGTPPAGTRKPPPPVGIRPMGSIAPGAPRTIGTPPAGAKKPPAPLRPPRLGRPRGLGGGAGYTGGSER
jgi:hypothetical protein